jgi:hypothetical protein
VVELQAFLGLFNYYRKFVPAAAKIVKPLTDALQGGLRPQHKIQWSVEQQQAFLAAKAAIAATWHTRRRQRRWLWSQTLPVLMWGLCYSSVSVSSPGGR